MCGRQVAFDAALVAHDAIDGVDAYVQRRRGDLSPIVVGALSEERSKRRVEALAVQVCQFLPRGDGNGLGQVGIDFVQRTRDGDDADNT